MDGKKDSLKTTVTQALRDNPQWAAQRDNAELYKAVGAETDAQKTTVRGIKKKYKRGEYDAPPGWNSRRNPPPDEKPPPPLSVEASVFRVSGKGDLTDRVVEYFRDNPHRLEQRGNTELYEAVGADDDSQKTTARGIKRRLKIAVRESGIGMVAVEVRKAAVESVEELDKDLETMEVILTPKQMKAAQIFHAGATKTDAVMQAYGYDYDSARKNQGKVFKREAVETYLRHLRAQDDAEAVRKRRKFCQEREEIARAADMSHFAEWDVESGGPKFKKIVPQWALTGMKSIRITNKEVATETSSTTEQTTSFTLYDGEKIRKTLEADYEKPFHNGGANSGDLEIQELWERFQTQDKENSLTAIGMAHELASRGYPVPEPVKLQAQYELARMEPPPPGDDDMNPEDFTFEELNKKGEETMGDYLEYLKEQKEKFLPERDDDLKEIAAKHGYDRVQKPLDTIISGDDEIEPPFDKNQDGPVGEDSGF